MKILAGSDIALHFAVHNFQHVLGADSQVVDLNGIVGQHVEQHPRLRDLRQTKFVLLLTELAPETV